MDMSFFWHGVPVDCEIEITDWDDGFDVAVDKIMVGGIDIMPIIASNDDLLEQVNNIAHQFAVLEFEQNDVDARIDAIMEWKGYEH